MNKPLLILLSTVVTTWCSLNISGNESVYTGVVIDAIINSQFDRAMQITDSIIAGDSSTPLAPVLKLVAIGMRDVDFDETLDSAGFLKTYRLSMKNIEHYESKHGVSSYTCTLKGFSQTIRSAFYLRIRSYGTAVQTGFDGLAALKEAQRLDRTNTDVNLFLGLYNYAKGELKKKLWWVLFWYPGVKADGIQELEECARSARIASTGARMALADIYTREQNPARSAIVLQNLRAQYPGSRFVLWSQVKYLESQKMYSQAALLYDTLATSYEKCAEGKYNSLVTRNHQAHMYELAGERDNAINICRTVLNRCDDKRSRPIKHDTEKMIGRLNESKG